jgi:sec-independent protein translocase protein TatB
MLSLPHLVVLFVVALVIFGPEKLPELARMLGKATADFRKMSGDFRYALEEEVRELERQTRVKEAAAAAAAQPVPEPVPVEPEGVVPRALPAHDEASPTVTEPPTPSEPEPVAAAAEAATPDHEKPSDANPAV